jgi:hypothetical protein
MAEEIAGSFFPHGVEKPVIEFPAGIGAGRYFGR